jgi:nuclear transport factor 2 (NTF2) superfamily protein
VIAEYALLLYSVCYGRFCFKIMQELERTKGKSITVPKRARRYCVAYWTVYAGWQNMSNFHTTPESALEEFLRTYQKEQDYDYAPKFYTVYEVILEIPIVYGVSS